jgi:hypothetical protein
VDQYSIADARGLREMGPALAVVAGCSKLLLVGCPLESLNHRSFTCLCFLFAAATQWDGHDGVAQ